jgi:hypothetical protein
MFGAFLALTAMHDNKSTTGGVDMALNLFASILFGIATYN